MRIASWTARPVVRFLLAAATIALTTLVLRTWGARLGTPVLALLYLLPVGLATALWGLAPGIASAVLAFFAFNYFFIEPLNTLIVHHAEDTVILLVFLVVAVVISQLVGRAQAGMAASQAREQEASRLYQLNLALTGPPDDREIGRILCEQVRQTVDADRVDLEAGSGTVSSSSLAVPAPSSNPAESTPATVVALQTSTGRIGEIRVWRASRRLSESEIRLLTTFAGEGALALERAWLTKAQQRAQVLEESDRLKSALLSSVSHELRTPLATIKAAATSLRSGEVGWDSEARLELLSAIDDETDHLNRLVGNLLDMSRIEAGVLRPRRQWNLISEIAVGVVQRMQALDTGHGFQIDISEDLPLVPVDYVQLEQVFTNLISNGLKYAPAGSMILVRASLQDPDSLLVEVANEGPHVAPEDLGRIFDKFYRVTAADRVTGTGLGLSICKGIIEAHGGRIWAENLPSGFAFFFTIPLAWDGAPPPHVLTDGEGA
jgi:two-component system sensor histidine kinase KdpD